MERIFSDTIVDIQKKVNIVDIISKYLPLEKHGKNYFAICPFHDDHNPSLSVSPEKQIYTCFVCGASGNVFNFVMNYEKVTFLEAVKKVADFANIKVDINVKNNKTKSNIDDKKYYDMFNLTCKFYQNNLKSNLGKSAKEYLEKRNIDDDVINKFKIGLSLNNNELNKLLTNKGYKVEDLIDIGLCGNKDNFIFDIFRNRIMFALDDSDGNTVGFSGRIYNGEDESKYVNSKESKIFKKGKLLYNYFNAKEYTSIDNEIIIVEGFMDVIRLYTVGIKNVVATMGTAITKDHASLIRRLSKNVVLCFDGDKAGEKATIAALKELEDINLSPKIIRLEDNLDPDEYILKNGKEGFLNHLKNAMNAFEFKMDINKNKTDFNDFNEISKYIKTVINDIKDIKDDVVLELTIKKLAKQTNVDIDTIKDMIKQIPKKEIKIIKESKQVNKDKYDKAEEYLIYYMLRMNDAINIYQNKVSYLNNRKLSKIAMLILEFYEKMHYINLTEFTLFLEDDVDLINEVLRIDNLNLPSSVELSVIEDYVTTIDNGILKKEINKLKEEIKREVNVAKKVSLLQKLATLKKKECK